MKPTVKTNDNAWRLMVKTNKHLKFKNKNNKYQVKYNFNGVRYLNEHTEKSAYDLILWMAKNKDLIKEK